MIVRKVEKRSEEICIYPVKFKVARIIKDYTIEELSQKAGITKTTIVQIEKGRRTRIALKTFRQLVTALEQSELDNGYSRVYQAKCRRCVCCDTRM